MYEPGITTLVPAIGIGAPYVIGAAIVVGGAIILVVIGAAIVVIGAATILVVTGAATVCVITGAAMLVITGIGGAWTTTGSWTCTCVIVASRSGPTIRSEVNSVGAICLMTPMSTFSMICSPSTSWYSTRGISMICSAVLITGTSTIFSMYWIW